MEKETYCILAGGCFWCISMPYYEIKGINKIISGFCGGTEINPTYEDVKAQKTTHMESIKIVYDESIISYKEILKIFFDNIDPFDDGGQFIDRGYSYTTAIFYQNDLMKDYILDYINIFEAKHDKKVCVKVLKESEFYLAEEYHQDFSIKNKDLMAKELVISGRKKNNK